MADGRNEPRRGRPPFPDLVDSAVMAGTMVTTTGDGLVATFDAPAVALPCAAEIQARSVADGRQVRVGIQVGVTAWRDRARS